ncbi:hypothetical protein [Pseudoneobacillus sp. C159]
MIKPILSREETCPVCDGDGRVYFDIVIGGGSRTFEECKGSGKV